MRQFYPAIRPYANQRVDVSGGHALYVEECGIPEGIPVLFVHGGPGAGCSEQDRRFFDPEKYRIILFDQRGAGRSRPHADLNDNTTAHLLADMETLRERLGVERWLLFGGSWGSTLALAYAQAHPEAVIGAVLRGIFLGRRQEVEWFLYGLARFFPDAYAAFSQFLPEEERKDLLRGYLARLLDPNPAVHGPAARVWSIYEGSCSTLMPNTEAVATFAHDRTAIGLARIEAFYFANDLFLPEGGLLSHMHRLRGIPGEIVQGRYDMICPPHSAFELAAAWPEAKFTIVPDAGHSALEPGVRRALIAALERFRVE
jgi:proline iminopeptidase